MGVARGELFTFASTIGQFVANTEKPQTKESIAQKKTEKKEKKAKKRNKALGKGVVDEANGSAKPNATTASNVTKDVPIATKTGATGSAASEGIAAGTSVVTERRNMQARVEEVED